jgi:phospholipase/carboxylesterase
MAEITLGALRAELTGGVDGHGGGTGPVVVLMHGFGAPGRDLVNLGRALTVPREVRFVFPAAPLEAMPGTAWQPELRAWWLIDIEERMRRVANGELEQMMSEAPQGIAPARAAVLGLLDELQVKLAVGSERVILGGFSQGAMLATDIVLRDSRPFAGLAILSGTLFAKEEWSALLPARRGLPVVQSHGRADPILPFSAAERLHGMLQAAGLQAEFLPFNGGHGIPPQALERLAALIAAVCARP